MNIREYRSKIFQILSKSIVSRNFEIPLFFRNSIELIGSLIIFDRYYLTIDLWFIRLFLVNVDLGFPYWPFHHTVNIRNLFGPSNSISLKQMGNGKNNREISNVFLCIKALARSCHHFYHFIPLRKKYRSYKINYYVKGV